MTPTEYLTASARTNGHPSDPMSRMWYNHPTPVHLVHAMTGMCTETGEFADHVKRVLFYGKPLDKVNLKEELGDLMWYVALACRTLDLTLEEVMDANIAKLRARYPDQFTEEHALSRDLERERSTLEMQERASA